MKNMIVLTLILAAFSGCASNQPVPMDTISKLPILRVGDKPLPDSEYILFIPAGYTIPIKLNTSGSLFSEKQEIESTAKLSKNLYLYKYWASHDKTTWKKSHELLGVQFGGGLGINGIQVNVELEAN